MQKYRLSVKTPRQDAKGDVPPLETAKYQTASERERKVVMLYAEVPFECRNT